MFKGIVKPGIVKSYILDNKIKSDSKEPVFYYPNQTEQIKKEEFDEKKALKPLLIATTSILAGFSAISIIMKKYSNVLAYDKGVIRPPDLARNHNIVDEFQFALYRALREPDGKNILGVIGVGLMSGVVLCAKSFCDGIKDVWCKKQEFNIKYDFEKKSIDAKTRAFSGKLNAQTQLYQKTKSLLDSSIENKKESNFSGFLSFKGEKKEESRQKNKIIPIIGAVGAFLALSFCLFKNFQKTAKNLDTFVLKMDDAKIREEINQALNEKSREKLADIFKSTNAAENQMIEILNKLDGIKEEEIQSFINKIKEERTYIDAPSALGGISEKIQYYCYIDEDRGHLYNWILNPENKFNKYLFLTFTSASATGYVLKSTIEAIKQTTVEKENKKNELNLINNLVEVEVSNYRTKKEAAINPMIENLKKQANSSANKEELEKLKEEILLEIKNGPPYIYD